VSLAYIPIQRTFSELPKTEENQSTEDFSHFLNRNKTKWDDLLNLYRVVILAEAGAGKTEEMKQTAIKLHSEGKASFFIRIENIDSDFAESFEGAGSEEEFDEWLESENEAWFFLDSVDEAKLESHKAFKKALKKFSKGIRTALSRSHIYISSRPYAWLPKTDTESVDSVLPLNQFNSDADKNEPVPTQLYILNPLHHEDIQTFAHEREVENIDEFMAEIALLNIQSLASRPFDLELAIQKFKKDGKLGNRIEMIEHNINQMLNESHNPNRSLETLDIHKAHDGAKVLAAAVTLVNESGINIPDSITENKGFASEEVLTGWKSSEIKVLVNTGLFNDILYGSVRFRHKEIRDYLSAEWFYSLLKQDGNLRAIEDLFIANMYGEEVIRPRLRPILPWLILFDEPLRKRVLSIAPEIVVEGGDISSLALSERKEILSQIVYRISLEEDNHRSARDNTAIARIAQIDLQDCVLELVQQYKNSDDAIFYLGRLAWLMRTDCCNDELAKIAVDTTKGIYARSASIRAIMTSGTDDQKYLLWEQINALDEALPRTLLVEIIADAPVTEQSVELLLISLRILEPYKRFQHTGLSSALSEFINRLKTDENLLLKLVSGLYALVSSGPYIEKRDCKVSKEFYWLIPLSLEIIEHFVTTHSKHCFTQEVISTLLLTPRLKYWAGGEIGLREYKGELHTLIPQWDELNDYLFWETVESERKLITPKGKTLNEYRQVQFINRELFNYSDDDFTRVLDFLEQKVDLDDQMVALTLAFELYDRANRPEDWFTQLEESVQHKDISLSQKLEELKRCEPICEFWAKHEKERLESQLKSEKEELEEKEHLKERIQEIKDNPSVILNKADTYPEGITYAQYWMLESIQEECNGSLVLSAKNYQYLVNIYGQTAADNFIQLAKEHWKVYQPNPRRNSDSYEKLGALGLEFDFQENPDIFATMSEEDVSKALPYIASGLNELSSWLKPLFLAHTQSTLDFIFNEVKWELESTSEHQTKYYILSTLSNHGEWLHQSLAPLILNWLYQNEPKNYDNFKECLNILFSGIESQEKIANLAIRKISNPKIKFNSFWYVILLCTNNNIGFHKLKTKLESFNHFDDAKAFSEDFVVKLVVENSSGGYQKFYSSHNPKLLADLYLLMNQYIKVVDDERHTSGEIYTPSRRDDAQDSRSRLFSLLTDIPGKETYFEIHNLVDKLPVKNSKSWLISSATFRAEKDSELKQWTTKQVVEFSFNALKTPTTHRELFQLGLRHLLELKDWLEKGNDSLADTYKKAKDETEVRKIIAFHLRQKAFSKYTCNEEQPLANEQRPDIWLERPDIVSPVPIEIKQLDKNWSGNKLCERLRNQLVGDYLREVTSGCGVFLLVWNGQTNRKGWEINGQNVKLAGLQKALQDYWQSISSEYPTVESIEVIVIDLTKRKHVSED